MVFKEEHLQTTLQPLAVVGILSKKGFSEDYLLVGLFNRLLVDTPTTEEEILALSNPNVLAAVQLLKSTKKEQLEEYLAAVAEIDLAKQVKLAERLHNLRSARIYRYRQSVFSIT